MLDFKEINRNAILLGASDAGKTQLLWAAHHAAQLAGGLQRFALPSDCDSIVLVDSVSGDEPSLENALYGPEGVKASRMAGGRLDSTSAVVRSAFEIHVNRVEPRQQERALFRVTDLAGVLTANIPTADNRTKYPEEVKRNLGLQTVAETHAITNKIDSVIQCIPMHDLNPRFKMDALLEGMNNNLWQSITICITKFDSIFLDKPVLIPDEAGVPRTHFAAACDPEFVRPIIRERLGRPDIISLIDKIRDRGKFADIKVMPVSSFGFLERTGQANVRPAKDEHYEMLTATPSISEPTNLSYPYTESEVYEIGERFGFWRPFQAFEALFSVLFPIKKLQMADICVFDLSDVMPDLD